MPTQPSDVLKGEIPFSGISPQEQLDQSFSRLLAYTQGKIARYHPYYRRLFRQQGIDPMAMRSYEDFRKIPLTRKEAIVENQADFTLWPRYPGAGQTHDAEEIDAASMERYRQAGAQPGFKDVFRPRPLEERVHEQFLLDWRPIHFQMSGGTTGKAIVTGYSHSDVHTRFARSGAWWYSLSPHLSPDDKWLNLFPAAPHLGIYATMMIPLMQGVPNFNTFGGKVTPTERQILIAAEDRYTVMIGLPSYMIHWLRLAVAMKEAGQIQGISTFRAAYCGGEPITEAYRSLLKDLFAQLGSPSVAVMEGMSSTELRTGGFYECGEGTKLHLDPAYYFTEILHPETHEPVAPGEPGVFVWSHIDWHGTGILRYWTGDYVSGGLITGTCNHCGLVIPRLGTPIWRAEKDSTKIKGTRIDLVYLIDAVRGSPGVRTFQVIIGKSDPKDPYSKDTLTIYVAAKGQESVQQMTDSVRQNVQRELELSPDAVIVESTETIEAKLFAKKLKAEWIIDTRPA
jgi:phenylacetate-coenzyme A ligase PaaK-like adenylate-forming protein